ncbi:MAG TPA: VOC family protein [Gaiellaceae bacterium]|nr:VOC family protein [Gaiellaceae bacterium]
MPTSSGPSVFPVLGYRDAAAALEWLREAFGFAQLFATPGPGGTIAHAEMRVGAGGIMLTSAPAGPADAEDWRLAAQSVYVVLDEVDEHCDRARAAGAAITRAPQETSYGSREYSARDLEGRHWHFGTYRPTLEVSG